jgi:hypothetical protein
MAQPAPSPTINVPRNAVLQPVRISSHGVTKDEENKPYTVYFIEVRSHHTEVLRRTIGVGIGQVRCEQGHPSSWTVYRRYQQFRRLNDALRTEAYQVPVLPPRKLLGQRDPDFIRQRKVFNRKGLGHN